MEAFDIYFASLVSMSLHPGYTREGTPQPTIEQCAELALQMLEMRNKLWPG